MGGASDTRFRPDNRTWKFAKRSKCEAEDVFLPPTQRPVGRGESRTSHVVLASSAHLVLIISLSK